MRSPDVGDGLGRLVGSIFVLVGSAITIGGLIWMMRIAMFVMTAAKAPGTVVEMVRVPAAKGGQSYHPVFTFTDAEGVSHKQQSSIGFGTYQFEPGQKVMVLYDKAAPLESKIDSFKTLWLVPLLITGFGLVFGGFACFWLRGWTRAARWQQERGVGLAE